MSGVAAIKEGEIQVLVKTENGPVNTMIIPIGIARQNLVIEATAKYIDFAEKLFGMKFNSVSVKFDLKGKTAGMYKVSSGERVIRYNPYIFSKYFSDSLAVTVPHEVAHYIINVVYGRRRIRPHGDQWKNLMAEFGADASRTCNYDLEGIPRRVHRRLPYRCDCTRHNLTVRRHNQIQWGIRRYVCKQCGVQLTPEF